MNTMSNKKQELAREVYNEIFPSAEEIEIELTRPWARLKNEENPVRNQQVGITEEKVLRS